MINLSYSKLVIELFSSQDCAERLQSVLSILEVSHIFKDIKLFYCTFNEVENTLESSQYGLSVKILDQSDPLAYSFLVKKNYLVENIVTYPKLSSVLGNGYNQVFLIPLESFGVLGFYGTNEGLHEKAKQEIVQEVANLFLSSEKVIYNQKRLENEVNKTHQEVKLLQKRDNNILKESYLNHVWIDFSGSSKSVKRDILFYAKTNRVLNIIGSQGIGRSYLASIIQRLRNAYGDSQNFVDLASVRNVEQLSSIFGINHKKINYFDYYYDATLILENIDLLSPELLNKLYELLNKNEDIRSNQVKIIITSKNKKLHKECSVEIINFFNQETLTLHNRMDNEKNFSSFTESFISDYCRENLKRIKGITQGALTTLQSSQLIHSLDDLKRHVFAICDIVSHGNQIDKYKTKRVLEHVNMTKNIGLPELVAQYEKSLILKKLTLNNWNQEETAQQFNIPRRTLSYKCSQHNIKGKYAK
ncbi:helix-turn-helix domain-containing protein [Pasteurella atlantica]|uniref:Helix-turn-helix domain-containing protein n=2 Tax=Pasteurellaceae TaxID=712 RepID=A0ACC6HP75_9PAST|nr:helix-turn-helix domain-containing protein [Pasteurella atlantica]MDP8052629.1 helix-turn-helix domain-containing protein [Pasteurella atlantica]MDP8105771.1 helix-turn-helix domain-containing protein [Pasteurella atlantica]MDP8149287.1 helix-turn-helix domain-containing protein [Pasteurella atlantica]